jgi:molybdate transport system ATP-binding protein
LNSEAPVLEVRLRHRVHVHLHLDITMRLGSEIGVLFGPSGSGKTTTLRLIAGLSRPDEGYVRLGETVLCDTSRGIAQPLQRRQIGMIFQDDLLFPHLLVSENIGFGLNRMGRAERRRRVSEVAALCGVEALLDRRPETLSGGERQRVGLARTLAPRPRLVLCDEPVSALDLPNRQVLLDRLRTVQRAERVPVLYVTHSPAEAVSLGTRLFLLNRGTLVAEGAPLDVLSPPQGPSFLHLEGIVNTLHTRVLDHAPGQSATRLRVDDGPILIVPYLDQPEGSAVVVEVRGDDILLARAPVGGLSARNLVPGVVERVVSRGPEAEVVVRTGGVTWIVSLVTPAVEQLGLAPGASVHMIIKARACHVAAPGDR